MPHLDGNDFTHHIFFQSSSVAAYYREHECITTRSRYEERWTETHTHTRRQTSIDKHRQAQTGTNKQEESKTTRDKPSGLGHGRKSLEGGEHR
jgi:hypothetical protein